MLPEGTAVAAVSACPWFGESILVLLHKVVEKGDMIRGLWLLLDGPSRKPLIFDLPVHMYNQIIPQMPFPWSNSIQITVCKKPSEKTFRPNELMPGVCKTTCAQDQNLLSSSNMCHGPVQRQGVPQQRGSLVAAESLPGPGSRTACRPLATTQATQGSSSGLFLGMASFKVILHLSHPFCYPKCFLKEGQQGWKWCFILPQNN